MGKKAWLIAGGAAAAIVAVALWETRQSHQDAAPATAHTSVPNQTTARANVPSVAPQSQLKAPPSTPTELKVSKARQFDEYVKAGTPADKFKAYLLAQSCVAHTNMRRAFEMIPPGERTSEVKAQIEAGEFKAGQEAACGDLTDRQIAARIEYVKVAAEAGLPGAAVYLSGEPPFGDATAYETRPDDPAVLEYRRHIVDLIKLAASKGDPWSMVVLSDMYATGQGEVEGPDPVKALEYHFAWRDAMAKAGSKMLPYVDKKTKDLEQGLTVQQIEAAKNAGHIIALGGEK